MGIITAEQTATAPQQQYPATTNSSSGASQQNNNDDVTISHTLRSVPEQSRDPRSSNATRSVAAGAGQSKEMDVLKGQSPTLQHQCIPDRSMSAGVQPKESEQRSSLPSSRSRETIRARILHHQPLNKNVDSRGQKQQQQQQSVLRVPRVERDNCRQHIFQVVVAMLLVMFWLEGVRPVEAVQTPLSDILTDTQFVISLTDWQLSSDDQVHVNLSAPGIIPGDVQTILLRNGVIQDPYLDRNFVTQRHIWMGGDADPVDGNFTKRRYNTTWVYSTIFETPAPSNTTETSSLYWKVILEGVKMGADVAVNGIQIGEGR